MTTDTKINFEKWTALPSAARRKTVNFENGQRPFCQKARPAAVAQQNIGKLLKKKCFNIHTYIHTCIHTESPENGLAGFPKGLQYYVDRGAFRISRRAGSIGIP